MNYGFLWILKSLTQRKPPLQKEYLKAYLQMMVFLDLGSFLLSFNKVINVDPEKSYKI